MSYFRRTRPHCKIESFYTTGRKKKNDHFSVDGSLTEEDIKRGSRRRELDELRRGYIQEKGFTVIEMWECECWRIYKTTTIVKLHIRENFLYR